MNKEPSFNAGSLKTIIYIAFQLIDEIMHAFDWLWPDAKWRFCFCQWAYRHDYCYHDHLLKEDERDD